MKSLNSYTKKNTVEKQTVIQIGLMIVVNLYQYHNLLRHIEAIMRMEEGIQASIMNAIRDLMVNPEPSSPQGIPDFPPQINSLQDQLEAISLAKEGLERRCNELDLQGLQIFLSSTK
ncbi:hypothetical protein Anas_03131 [Armadillidium nasatum]|uniref:Uncharacterized protein n=1 Tax=Armadillidium nasatum TaxID=96803 RepID=A0A5N5TPR5_9CRUS|nr:hypothetical protein Anas_03131 [Armadillidium nasatum]